MKICHITTCLPKYHRTWGGAEQACLSIVNIMKDRGEKTTVLAVKPEKTPKEFEFYPISTVGDYMGKFGEYMKNIPNFDPISYLSIKKHLMKIKPDVINLYKFDLISFSVIKAAKDLKIPVVFSVYDFSWFCPLSTLINKDGNPCRRFTGIHCMNCIKRRKGRKLKKIGLTSYILTTNYFLKKIDAFIVLSNCWKEILSLYGIESKKVHVIPLPIEGDTSLKDVRTKKNSILFVGWIQERKGLKILVEALPQILKKIRNAKIYVIGSVSNRAYYESILDFIKKNKIEKNIIFLGKLPNKDVIDWIRRSEVIAVPEQWEIAWPIFLTEAMALGKPVVASNIGGIPDLIKNGKNGFIVNPKDPKEFADKITWFLENPLKAHKMAKMSREDALRITNKENIYRRLINLYENLLKQNKG